MAQEALAASLTQEGPEHWWFGGQHLYEVFLKPIYFGPAAENRSLGFVVIGYEIDDRSRFAGQSHCGQPGGFLLR